MRIAEAVKDDVFTHRKVVIGIGEFAVSNRPGDVIVTHALGSCIAVCLYDPVSTVAGMLHFLLPEARINPERAKQQPAVFADTGIPLLFQAAFERGLKKQRARVYLVGGAEMTQAAAVCWRRRISSGVTACSSQVWKWAAPAQEHCICRCQTGGWKFSTAKATRSCSHAHSDCRRLGNDASDD